MLRHYDTLGLVRPTGRSGTGYREYSDDDIRRIFHVESLRSLGLSLRDVGRALDDPEFAPSGLVEKLIGRTRERIATQTELLTRLERVNESDPNGWTDVLAVVALLQDLGSVSAGKRQSAALSSADIPIPADVLADAVLNEPAPNVAGALRWALAQSEGDVSTPLRAGLESSNPQVRRRAVETIVEIPHSDATDLLRYALDNDDEIVRRYAALELGARGVVEAIPTLIDMVHVGVNDVDAADALGGMHEQAESIVRELLARPIGTDGRLRIAQALAEIPGVAAGQALSDLTRDDDRAVALTAGYILGKRED